MGNPPPSSASRRFGALVYKTLNLGDEIQTLAAMRFLPHVDALIDRDNLATFEAPSPISLVLNGWFAERPSSWPPAPVIQPLLISLHLSPTVGTFDPARVSASEFFLQEPAIQYLRRHGPVGARDLHTLKLLEKHQVPAYFSGCLTLTLQQAPDVTRTDDIVLNDVPDEVLSFIKRTARRTVQVTTHQDSVTPFGEARLAKARELLRLYQSAHLVITTRLHCALPCLALGTKVLLLKTGQEAARLEGLENLVNTASIAELISNRVVNLESPEPNPSDHEVLRASLEASVLSFVGSSPSPAEPAEHAENLAESRFQTLAAIHARRLEAHDRMQVELQRTTGELAGVVADRDQLRAAVQQLAKEMNQLRLSPAWRVARLLRDIAARFPRATAPVRRFVARRLRLEDR